MLSPLLNLKQKIGTPLAIVAIVLFVVLPIVLAAPLFVWLTRRVDGWLASWSALARTENRLRAQHGGVGGKLLQEPVASLSSAAGSHDPELPRDLITHPFTQTPIRSEFAAVDRQ